MANLARRSVEKALAAKGFVRDDHPRHHRYYRLHVDGKRTEIYTYTSTGRKYKTLGDELVNSMAKQVFLTKKQFQQLVECSLSGDKYVVLLKEQKKL